MAFGVIYGLEYLVDHRIYVGQTTRKLYNRISEHKSAKITPIDRAITEYGWENFTYAILEECDTREELDAAERCWIERLNCTYPHGFNRDNGGKTGFKHHKSTREKITTGQLGHAVLNSTRMKLSVRNKKIFFPNLDAELNRQKITYTTIAKLLKIPAPTLTGKLNGSYKLDEKTTLAIKEILGVDMPIEELFKTVAGNEPSDVEL